MKTFTLLAIIVLAAFASNAQINTQLRIYHKLGTQDFQMNTTTQNNIGQDYQITRLQYYVTEFSVIHDGGQVTQVNSDVVGLINVEDGPFSTVELGSLNITTVEEVKFHIGVHSSVNNLDPTQYPTTHPLYPQSPSMHWGWASGYRFLVYEGKGGSNFSQTFQMHGLGNANYFETSVVASGQDVAGNLIIALDADYTRGVESINVSNGVIAHGINTADLTTLENFRDYVFSSSSAVITANTNEASLIDWNVYPNPLVNGDLNISFDNDVAVEYISITNALGQEVSSFVPTNSNVSISLPSSGIYFVNLMGASGLLDTKRIIKQ